MKDQIDVIGDLLLRCGWPLLVGQTGETGNTLDDKPVLLVPVLDPVVDLSVSGGLARDLLLKTDMPVLKERHPILMMAHLFLNNGELSILAKA